MNTATSNHSDVVIAGFGSPHGDDQAGWRLVEWLSRRQLPACVLVVQEATQLLAALSGCRQLVIVDACRSDFEVGTITHMQWPDERIAGRHQHSTHGLGIWGTLLLAEQLGTLPPQVEIFGIEVADCRPGGDLSPPVERAVAKLEAILVGRLREVAYA